MKRWRPYQSKAGTTRTQRRIDATQTETKEEIAQRDQEFQKFTRKMKYRHKNRAKPQNNGNGLNLFMSLIQLKSCQPKKFEKHDQMTLSANKNYAPAWLPIINSTKIRCAPHFSVIKLI
jgi:hypothetical protein